MRHLPMGVAAAALFFALPALAVDVPDRVEFDALAGRVLALEQAQPATQADLDALRQESEAADSALQQAIDALQALIESYHPPVVDNPPTVANLTAACDEGGNCAGDIGATDDNGPVTVTWGASPLLNFTGIGDGTWSADPLDGDGLATYGIPGEVSDGVNPPVSFTLQITINDTITEPDPDPLPEAVAGANLGDCVAQLDTQGGGWCEMRVPGDKPGISSVWPVLDPVNNPMDARIHQIVGPAAVLHAWNSTAFDRTRNLMYFIGGGHADYGGNEVYGLGLNTGTWTRLTDPSPMTHVYPVPSPTNPNLYAWTPDNREVPLVAHSYDGLHFNEATGTILYITAPPAAANGAQVTIPDPTAPEWAGLVLPDAGAGIFEFNPDRTEARNGIAPLSWRKIYSAGEQAGINLSYPRMANLPDGTMAVGTTSTLWRFNPQAPTGQKFGARLTAPHADYGDGNTILHSNGRLYSVLNYYLIEQDATTGAFIRAVSMAGFNSGRSVVEGPGGLLWFYESPWRIATWDPNNPTGGFLIYDWSDGGPQVGNAAVYGKFVYLPTEGVFVVVTTHLTGVWVYKHPAGMQPVQLGNPTLPQSLINAASAGDTVTIPPASYNTGLTINKSLTLNLAGVQLWGVANQKGIINVNCDDCTVVINDFEAEGKKAKCTTGNCAGIKVEGIGFDLTVNGFHIDGTNMAILTDNRGGVLRLNDGVAENMSCNRTAASDLGHGIYAGKIDEVHASNVTVRNSCNQGHLFKSRAPVNTLDGVTLDGGPGSTSRLLEFTCGGSGVVSNSLLYQRDTTTNTELVAYAPERHLVPNCGELTPDRIGTVTFDNVELQSDRDKSPDEPAYNDGWTTFFRIYGPADTADPARFDLASDLILTGVTFGPGIEQLALQFILQGSTLVPVYTNLPN